MSDSHPSKPSSSQMQALLLQMYPRIAVAVRQACRSLGHHPDQAELDGFIQRIVVLLMENDYHTLRSFSGNSEPQIWLRTIARRHILHLLRKEKRKINIEDLPLDSFVSQPHQEEEMFLDEMKGQLRAAVRQLTAHERNFFDLMMEGLKTAEIAKRLDIKVRSARTEKSALIKKLGEIIHDK
ncbi:MAG TPA: sigma-70 family RNA polymerase sigma factor [Blastocatellia bacterium]|nr:sigma-70 family RNA polymerase sigma factor [Blastocatellia bacterium]HMX26834.1 sigma-70 family RNA polymerase sigma factor [Blastocatellia bacterium]HMZ18982.1 sigma-70 family RNA polymerase sigma factor [Blastocatellia bacterium]HNG32463.1 sigma-70 family RNA polymerase sigma factor [Blastocatellia bacterium]